MKPEKPRTEDSLKRETTKWLAKLERDLKHVRSTGRLADEQFKEAMENIRAYISDCKYFSEEGDLINAFEAIVYAWAILETMQRCGLITTTKRGAQTRSSFKKQ
jgi:hypothetical protein